jgi:hypothetical protein
MGTISHIDVEESLRRGKLIYRRNWAEYFETFIFYLFPVNLLGISVVTFIMTDFGSLNGNEKAFYEIVWVLTALFCPYILFRLITQRWLTRISTKGTENENKKLLSDYVKKYDYQLHHPSANCIILTDETIMAANIRSTKRLYIFLFSGSDIFYCALKFGTRTNPPSLFQYWVIRKDIKKWVRQRDQ